MLHLQSKLWKIGMLHYRHFYIASYGGEVCYITDIFSPHAVEKQCAALPTPLPSTSGGEVSCITGNFTQQAVEKK